MDRARCVDCRGPPAKDTGGKKGPFLAWFTRMHTCVRMEGISISKANFSRVSRLMSGWVCVKRLGLETGSENEDETLGSLRRLLFFSLVTLKFFQAGDFYERLSKQWHISEQLFKVSVLDQIGTVQSFIIKRRSKHDSKIKIGCKLHPPLISDSLVTLLP